MTENAMIPVSELNLPSKYNKDAFSKVSKASAYLERIQLLGGNSGIVKRGQFPMNHYGLAKNKDNFEDLGEEFDGLVLSWRPKAMEIGKEILSLYDPEDSEFDRIVQMSEVQNSGCMYGPEYLIWLPKQEKFATLFCSSKTLRRASDDIQDRLGKYATFSVNIIDNGKYVWPGPVIEDCTTPHPLPEMERVKEEIDKFVNPPKNEVEKAEASDSGGRER